MTFDIQEYGVYSELSELDLDYNVGNPLEYSGIGFDGWGDGWGYDSLDGDGFGCGFGSKKGKGYGWVGDRNGLSL